jgi:hypothetical protein
VFDNGYVLAAVLVAVACFNGLAVLVARRAHAEQSFYVSAAVAGGWRMSVVPSLLFAAVAAVACAFLDPQTRRLLGGGMMLTQAGGAALSCGSWLLLRSLRNPAMGSGQLRFGLAYRYRSAASQLVTLSLLFWFSYLLSSDLMFLGGGIFTAAAAAGYFRRARQVPPAAPEAAAALLR